MAKLSLQKLKQKKIRLSASYGKRRLYYFLTALIATLLVLAGSQLSSAVGTSAVEIFVKFALAFLAFVLARQSGYLDPAGDGRFFSPCFFLILPPLILSLLAYLGPLNLKIAPGRLIVLLLGVLPTALWEELFFRLWGRILFEEKGTYRPADFLFLALTFGAMHLVNAFSAPIGVVAVQVMLAVVTALFLQTIYAVSGSLRLPLLYHFLLNLISQLLGNELVPEGGERFFPALLPILPLLLGAWCALSAAVLARRKGLLRQPGGKKKKAGGLFFRRK